MIRPYFQFHSQNIPFFQSMVIFCIFKNLSTIFLQSNQFVLAIASMWPDYFSIFCLVYFCFLFFCVDRRSTIRVIQWFQLKKAHRKSNWTHKRQTTIKSFDSNAKKIQTDGRKQYSTIFDCITLYTITELIQLSTQLNIVRFRFRVCGLCGVAATHLWHIWFDICICTGRGVAIDIVDDKFWFV